MGLKVTVPRTRILRLFEKGGVRHLSAENIFRHFFNEGASIGLATIYRVLSQFEQAGVLIRHAFGGNRYVFELNDSEHHDHIVCLDCGYVEEFFDEDIEKKQLQIASHSFFHIRYHSLCLFAECLRKECPRKSEIPAREMPA